MEGCRLPWVVQDLKVVQFHLLWAHQMEQCLLPCLTLDHPRGVQ